MAELIIGFAGHVDHGKTSLIKAINGYDGDTSELEKERQITMMPSYSSFNNLGIIDVPGHENLLESMIKAAYGFGVVVFVIDINEGLKEQSKEHLRILEALQIKGLIIAFTKVDKCKNYDALKEGILQSLKEYDLKIISALPTSTVSGEGIDELKKLLDKLANEYTKRQDLSKKKARLFVDKRFSIKGVGTLISGFLQLGQISLTSKIKCLQTKQELKIKSLQVHGENKEVVCSPSRVGIGFKNKEISILPNMMLSDANIAPSNNIDVILYDFIPKHPRLARVVYACELGPCKVRILGDCEVEKELGKRGGNEACFASLEFEKEVFLSFGDILFILENKRLQGFARVLNPISEPLKKRAKLELLHNLAKKDFKAAFIQLIAAHKKGFGLLCSEQRFGLDMDEAKEIARQIDDVFIDDICIYQKGVFEVISLKIKEIIKSNPNAMLSASLLEKSLKFASSKLCKEALKKEKELFFEGGVYLKKGVKKEACLNDARMKIKSLLCVKTPSTPLVIFDNLQIDERFARLLLKQMLTLGEVVFVGKNIYIEKNTFASLLDELKALLEKNPQDVQSIKKNMQVSRKYAIAYLEKLDELGVCVNEGGLRRLKKPC